MSCELCNIRNNIKTPFHGAFHLPEGSFIIVDCDTCKETPMVVFLKHEEPSGSLLAKAIAIAKALFPDRYVDTRRRKIPEPIIFPTTKEVKRQKPRGFFVSIVIYLNN